MLVAVGTNYTIHCAVHSFALKTVGSCSVVLSLSAHHPPSWTPWDLASRSFVSSVPSSKLVIFSEFIYASIQFPNVLDMFKSIFTFQVVILGGVGVGSFLQYLLLSCFTLFHLSFIHLHWTWTVLPFHFSILTSIYKLLTFFRNQWLMLLPFILTFSSLQLRLCSV